MNDKISIENVNVPGLVTNVDRSKYEAMREAMFRILPDSSPGLTHNEIMQALLDELPAELFPGGAKRGWWSKTVQLDLEAKGELARENTKPLRWYLNRDGG